MTDQEPLIPEVMEGDDVRWEREEGGAIYVNGQITGYAIPENQETPLSPISRQHETHYSYFGKVPD